MPFDQGGSGGGGVSSGTHAARPAAGTANRLYFETDTLQTYLDTGVAWTLVSAQKLAELAARAHSDLTGVGIDDHHARDHSVIGATHSGFPGGTATFLRADGSFAAPPASSGDMLRANNLSDVLNAATSRTNLGLATVAATGALADLVTRAHASLTGIGADDHHARQHAINAGADHTGTLDDSQIPAAITRDAELQTFSKTVTVINPTTGLTLMAWRAPAACTVTNVRSHFKGGTSVVYNAQKNQASTHLASNQTNGTANAWADGGAVQNATYAAGDDLEVMFVTITGVVTEASIQVDFTKTITS